MEEEQSFLYVWKSYEDIGSFFRYVVFNGVGKLKKESFNAVQNTIIANQNDRLYLFCLMVSAKLLTTYLVKSFSKQIDDEINKEICKIVKGTILINRNIMILRYHGFCFFRRQWILKEKN